MKQDSMNSVPTKTGDGAGESSHRVERISHNQPRLVLPRRVSRILFVRTDAIGDNVLASSLLAPLKRYYPDAEICVVCQSRVAPLYYPSPFVSKILSYNKVSDEALDKLEVEVKEWRPDLVINSAYSRDLVSDMISAWVASARVIGFTGEERSSDPRLLEVQKRIYTDLVSGVGAWTPELRKYDAFLSALGISAEPCAPVVWTDPAAEEFADDFFKRNNIPRERAIAFAPGAQAGFRVYERFAETFAMLKERGYILIGLGAEHELEYLRRSAFAVKLPCASLFGKTKLTEMVSVVARCSLLIGAESGPAHIACAVGTPQVVILGGGHFGRFMPYSSLTSAISIPFSCAKCDWSCPYETVACVKDIDPVVVRQAVEDRLAFPVRERPVIYLSIPRMAERGLKVYPTLEPDISRFTELGDVIVAREGNVPREITSDRIQQNSQVDDLNRVRN